MTYTEHRTSTRSFRIFDCYDTSAESGDYIAVPGYAILKVLSRVDSGDYINLVVQEGSNKPYQIDLLKPEVELAEQERNRLEAAEEEMSKPDWVVCHECGGAGCEYCNYGGIITELKPLPYTFAPLPKDGDFRFQPTEGTKGACNVLLHGEIIGYIEKIRNKKEFWANTPNSYYWKSEGEQFSSPLDAANHILTVNSKAA